MRIWVERLSRSVGKVAAAEPSTRVNFAITSHTSQYRAPAILQPDSHLEISFPQVWVYASPCTRECIALAYNRGTTRHGAVRIMLDFFSYLFSLPLSLAVSPFLFISPSLFFFPQAAVPRSGPPQQLPQRKRRLLSPSLYLSFVLSFSSWLFRLFARDQPSHFRESGVYWVALAASTTIVGFRGLIIRDAMKDMKKLWATFNPGSDTD